MPSCTPRDVIVQCSDGLHGVVTESEISDIATKFVPEEACRQLVELAARRGTEDNTSVQIVRIDQVPQVGQYRGIPSTIRSRTRRTPNEIQVGQILDGRFEITDVISRSGMSSVFQRDGSADRRDGGAQGAARQPRERPGVLFPVRARSGNRAGSSIIPASSS